MDQPVDSEFPSLPLFPELWQQTFSWQPDSQQQQVFQQLYQQVLLANRQFNLTRITEPADFWEKHLWDSLRGVQRFLLSPTQPEVAPRAIDIGTGAGFPGVPVAIVQPAWQVTLLDSTQKKVEFLRSLLSELQLNNGFPLVGRAEQLGRQPQHRGQYDLVLLRAVAPAIVCAEYALPLLKLGGTAVLYRGQWTEAEAEDLQRVAAQLGGQVGATEAFLTPLTQSVRHCVYLEKQASTPDQYPRPVGIPAQKPL